MKKKLIFVSVVLLLDMLLFPLVIDLTLSFRGGVSAMLSGGIPERKAALLSAWQAILHRTYKGLPYTALIREPSRRLLFCAMQFFPAWLFILSFWRTIPSPGGGSDVPPAAAGHGQYGTARWQTRKETNRSAAFWPFGRKAERGGIVLGVDLRRQAAWIDPEDRHTMIVGTTGSGKTRRLMLPTIWHLAHARESMVLTDPKGELYERTAKWLASRGYRVVLLDFRRPGRGNRWNPMQLAIEKVELGELAEATRIVWTIAHTMVHTEEGVNRGEPIWPAGAESTITALTLLTAMQAPEQNRQHMTTVYRILSVLGQPQTAKNGAEFVPLKMLMNRLRWDHPAKDAFSAAMLAPERTRGSFFANVATILRLFSDPSIAYLTAAQDHNLADIGREPTAVFLVIPDEDSTRYPLAALYIDQAYQQLVELANDNNGRVPVRVNMLFDEFGNMPRVKDFDKKLTVSRGRGIRWHLVVQDFEQIEKVYAKAASTIKGNCSNTLYLLTQSLKTAKEISEMCGKYTVQTLSSGASARRGVFDSNSVNAGLIGRELVTPDELLRWPEDRVLALRARQFPARLPLVDLSRLPCDKLFQPTVDEGKRHLDTVPFWIPGFAAAAATATNSDKKQTAKSDSVGKPHAVPAREAKQTGTAMSSVLENMKGEMGR